MSEVKQYLHLRVEVKADGQQAFNDKVDQLRDALDGFHYSGWIWTDDPRPANPLLYAEYRQ